MNNKNLPRNPGRNQHGNMYIYIYRKPTICGRSSDVPVAWTHTFVRCHWRFSFSTLRVQPTCSSSKSLRAKASSCVEKSLRFYLFKKKRKTKCEVYRGLVYFMSFISELYPKVSKSFVGVECKPPCGIPSASHSHGVVTPLWNS